MRTGGSEYGKRVGLSVEAAGARPVYPLRASARLQAHRRSGLSLLAVLLGIGGPCAGETGGQVIHYHGLPITPDKAAVEAVSAGHAFVSFAHPGQMGLAVAACQSFALDTGAFSAWRKGKAITDWSGYYDFAAEGKSLPMCDFAVIPDVIDGTEAENDALCEQWPLPRWFGAPVWHLHESLDRLERLAQEWPRVCLGSSGEFEQIGTSRWWHRMNHAMRTICDDTGRPICRLHGLRMLDPDVFRRFPFTSADSCNIGLNVGMDQAWVGTYAPKNKSARVKLLRSRVESHNAPDRYDFMVEQTEMFQ
jgi:hypothetical protein